MARNPRPAALNIDPSLVLRAAADAAGAQQYPAPALYVVATPIGNLADLTLRAIHVLSIVDALACEDTRVSAGLLRHLGLDKPLIALHQHNESEAAARVLQRLAKQGMDGQPMAIVLVEQFYDFAAELADQYLVMERGEVIARGPGSNMEADGVREKMSI